MGMKVPSVGTPIKVRMKATTSAPSGTNMQPWQVAVVTGAARQRISDAVLAARRAGESRVDAAHEAVRGVNYYCRLATTISAGEGSAKEHRPPPGGTRLLSPAGW